MQSKANTVDEYLAELPDDRRAALEAVLKVIRKSLNKGFEEGMQYGMIGWFVPHKLYPAGYHCDQKQPLPFMGLASQKQAMSLYLSCLYHEEGGEERFRQAWAAAGKKLDMGKSCIRFKKVEALALEVIADYIKSMTVQSFIASYEAATERRRKK